MGDVVQLRARGGVVGGGTTVVVRMGYTLGPPGLVTLPSPMLYHPPCWITLHAVSPSMLCHPPCCVQAYYAEEDTTKGKWYRCQVATPVASGMWHVVGGMWYVACGMWCVVCGMWCVACGMWCVACGVWIVACGVWHVACSMRHVACGLWLVACACGLWCVAGPGGGRSEHGHVALATESNG